MNHSNSHVKAEARFGTADNAQPSQDYEESTATRTVAPHEDDSLADRIKRMTREEAAALWSARLQTNHLLADLV